MNGNPHLTASASRCDGTARISKPELLPLSRSRPNRVIGALNYASTSSSLNGQYLVSRFCPTFADGSGGGVIDAVAPESPSGTGDAGRLHIAWARTRVHADSALGHSNSRHDELRACAHFQLRC